MDTPSYYMPYDSDDEFHNDKKTDKSGYTTDVTDATDATYDTDYDSEDLPDYEDPRIRREEDPRYAIIRTAGPNFNTVASQLKYQEHAPGSEYLISTNVNTLNNSLLYNKPVTTTQTSLFSIKSINRDKSVYKTSSYFTLKTPRVYKNVTKFQLVQLSFPNFSNAIGDITTFISTIVNEMSPYITSTCIPSCLNILGGASPTTNTISLYEQGTVDLGGRPISKTISIAPGGYNGDEIANALNVASNRTPPLRILPYDDFEAYFLDTRDYTLLFNEPGEYFHTHLTGEPIKNPTKALMMSYYFPANVVDLILSPTTTHAFVLYYYPILKEFLASGRCAGILDTIGNSYETVLDRCLHTFEGIDSAFYYNICLQNKDYLDAYRHHLTFELYPINKYTWSYDTRVKQFRIVHDTLHTSIIRDIEQRYSQIQSNQLSLAGLNTFTYQTLKTSQMNNQLIFNHLEQIVSTNLAASHGTSGYSYDATMANLPDTLVNIENNVDGNAVTLNGLSNFTSTIGGNYHIFAGIPFATTTFSTLHSSMAGYHALTNTQLSTISTIESQVSSLHHSYVSTFYSNALPQTMIQNRAYNMKRGVPAVLYGSNKLLHVPGEVINLSGVGDGEDCEAICKAAIEKFLATYYSCLPTNSIVNSLAYKLGLWNPLSISSLSVVSTLGGLGAFGNFNVLMQINTEQSFNNMDIAMNENVQITTETTGQVKFITAKILTSGLGTNDISQTCILNPIFFDGTLGKLDKLTIRLLLDDAALTPLDAYFPFDLPFTEWDATFQIDEEVAQADKSNIFDTAPNVQIPADRRPI